MTNPMADFDRLVQSWQDIPGWFNWRDGQEEAAAHFGDGDEAIDLGQAVERYLSDYFSSFGDDLPPPGLHGRILREVEYPLIAAALAATRGNQVKAADLLGVNRNTLRKKIRDLDISVVRSIR